MRILFAGTPQPAVPSLEALIASSRHEVVAVLTRPDAPTGRGRRMERSPVRKVAESHGIEVLAPRRARDPEFLERLAELAPDVCPVVAYGGLIPPAALAIPPRGWVNLHFSLLPAWRGAAPVQHALLAGDEITGACTFLLEEGLDTGPVYGTVTEEIRRTDTSGDLLERLAIDGARLLVATLDGIEDGELHPVPQPNDGITLAPKITVEDARVDWKTPAQHIDRQVRACTPAPGAWTTLGGERVKLFPLSPLPGACDVEPGRIVLDKRGMTVGTGSGHVVRLGDVQPQGKKRMSAADWARGLRLTDDAARFE
ncbi:methionyl-tRNA formyltransferase [Actinospica sp. MGRD01-02]|uniref:Methionyl-tRNA formyltransferase n=1 Tax=Actinospica acidithermotolerans TaxID=2828514 RepID=A0A941EEQ5_9ACTN|nr:methionyl-tRNA formyltransferase [Actinospica acidithermotolerans]MBR7826399.1 methionyl-tRNA formyltransferase [Actinospica acidithermotolerans]